MRWNQLHPILPEYPQWKSQSTNLQANGWYICLLRSIFSTSWIRERTYNKGHTRKHPPITCSVGTKEASTSIAELSISQQWKVSFLVWFFRFFSYGILYILHIICYMLLYITYGIYGTYIFNIQHFQHIETYIIQHTETHSGQNIV